MFDTNALSWAPLHSEGISPTPRAAHAACGVYSSQMVIYGGAVGGGSLAPEDLYLLDLDNQTRCTWERVIVSGKTPGKRYGHTMTFSKPYLIVHGGNSGNDVLGDSWLLNLEESVLKWTELQIDGPSPSPRVYHSAALCPIGTAAGMIIVYGGRNGSASSLNDTWGLRRHRSGLWDWIKAPSKNGSDKPIGRYQHSLGFLGRLMVVAGGRTNEVEALPMQVFDVEGSQWYTLANINRFRHGSWIQGGLMYLFGGFSHETQNVPSAEILRIEFQPLFANVNLLASYYSKTFKRLDSNRETKQVKKTIKISSEVFAANLVNEGSIQKVPIGELPSEPIRLAGNENKSFLATRPEEHVEELYSYFLGKLLHPKTWNPARQSIGTIDREPLMELCDQVEVLFRKEPTLLRLGSPAKIFGSIHGQYNDLMTFFKKHGAPSDEINETVNGDIEGFDYVFLGNIVNMGSNSLETLALLFSLKLKYKDQIHLIRGQHEHLEMTRKNGLAWECSQKLKENPESHDSVFSRINEVFEYLPLAGVINNQYLCASGGIGSTIQSLGEIETISRPLNLSKMVNVKTQKIVNDLLCSNPFSDETKTGVAADPNSKTIVGLNAIQFGVDRVRSFLKQNNLLSILRGSQCSMEGFQLYSRSSVISIFSALSYASKYDNKAAFLVMKKNCEIAPRIIDTKDSNTGPWSHFDQSVVTIPRGL
eukprot:CAMPEP_0114986488 /NCGR_PEP_ID=MMETSP0216-20121206/8454_1 /TAXON_ID=223996 /ORGANISM="Protocruzia adherens, Strain Boccale" /LENGTH=703 /DNA_ID=CAMNT_0002348929 /DNA_START=121 /DNA_END=2232 /DNA_ORIENTATION=-